MTARITANIPVDRLIARQVSQWERIRALSTREESGQIDPWRKAFFVISRDYGSGGNEIARLIAERLHWPVYDRELVEQIASQAKVHQGIIESFDEKRRNEIHVWLQTMFDKQALSTDSYIRNLVSILLTLAEQGQVIIVGRGANFVLGSPFGLRIKITAPVDWRLRKVMATGALSRAQALRRIKKVDEQRLAFIRHYYHADADDPCAFDLVVNTENKSLDWVADLLIATLKSKIEHM